jgi:DNA repair exonuclease SbcCD ATPase subunit
MAEGIKNDYSRTNSMKHQWRKDTSCIVCTKAFGVVGLVYVKKFYCKKCYRAVCANCSAENSDHTEAKKIEVLCKPCSERSPYSFSSFQLEELREKYLELRKVTKKIRETEESIHNFHQKSQYWEDLLHVEEKLFNESQIEISIEHFRKDKEEFKRKTEELKKELNTICQSIEDKETLYFESETYLMEEKNLLTINKKKAHELYTSLATKQDENIRLIQNLESFNLPSGTKKKTHQQMQREENLRKAYEKLKEEQAFFSTENLKLQEELTFTESEIQNRDETLKKMHEELKALPEEGDMEEDVLIQLNIMLEEQQNLIEKLKCELNHAKTDGEEERKGSRCDIF